MDSQRSLGGTVLFFRLTNNIWWVHFHKRTYQGLSSGLQIKMGASRADKEAYFEKLKLLLDTYRKLSEDV